MEALLCKQGQKDRAETGRETEIRLDSTYEAYKGDACHCSCQPSIIMGDRQKDGEVLPRVPS